MKRPAYEYMKPCDVRFRKYRSARSLAARFFAGMDGAKIEDVEAIDGRKDFGGRQMVNAIEANGFWGFCEDRHGKTPATVHYWHRKGLPEATLIYLLGHEVGHASGKPIRSVVAEETRADTYGAAAVAVLRELRRRR